jgi:hypothetical protein
MQPCFARTTLVGVLAATMFGCTAPTEIVVHVDTDMPQQMGTSPYVTAVRIDVARHEQDGGMGESFYSNRLELRGTRDLPLLPAEIGLVQRGSARTLDISVTPYQDSVPLFMRRAIATYDPGHIVRLDMFLAKQCFMRSEPCPAGTTCGAGGVCVPEDVGPLPLYDSGASDERPDGSAFDAFDVPDSTAMMDASMIDSVMPDTGPGGDAMDSMSNDDTNASDAADVSRPDATLPDARTCMPLAGTMCPVATMLSQTSSMYTYSTYGGEPDPGTASGCMAGHHRVWFAFGPTAQQVSITVSPGFVVRAFRGPSCTSLLSSTTCSGTVRMSMTSTSMGMWFFVENVSAGASGCEDFDLIVVWG